MPENKKILEEKSPEETQKKVEVSEATLNKLLAEVERLKRDNEMLKEVADKSRLAHWEARHRGEIRRKVRISTLNGKVVNGWEMVTDIVEKDARGVWYEKQDIMVHFVDGKSQKMPYRKFILDVEKMEGEIVAKNESDGKVIYKIKAEDGNTYEIADTFIN